jgi:2-methylisocitrate lyase-like PEP mutase family enzyme
VRTQADKAREFLELHVPGTPLLMPNPWDRGSAVVLASLGFRALATTSSGYAATLARRDGGVSRDEALAHAADLSAATDLPVSADLESGFGATPRDVGGTVALAVATGLAGLSIEDATGDPDAPIFERHTAVARIAAAAEQKGDLVLTARAENHLHGREDLDDTIARLVDYAGAGADALYAPGLVRIEDIARLVQAVPRPVNVLLRPGGPDVAALASAGVARISVGGAFAFTALGALVEVARELIESGTCSSWETARIGSAATAAFPSWPTAR